MARQKIEGGGIYHVYNRGVEKRDVFLDDGDRVRFVHYLYEFNNTEKTPNLTYHLGQINEVRPPKFEKIDSRKKVVDVLAFVLMPNHYHLVLRQREERGISLFMQKLGTGYTMFFNAKHEHSGVLFQGKFKYKPVTSQEQLQYLLHYVHLNPLPILSDVPNEGGRTSFIEKLLEYRWSSLPDYAGRKNFPSVTVRNEMLGMFGGSTKYVSDFKPFTRNDDTKLVDKIGDVHIDYRYH